MIRVKVLVPDIETPYFDGNIKETNYDEFKEFLENLRDNFGEIDCEANVVESEDDTTDEEDSEEQSDPIAEHIKDHPVIVKETDPKMKEFFDKLDNMPEDKTLLENLDTLDTTEEDDEDEDEEEEDSDAYCGVLVNIKKHIISDIYYRENPEVKRNAVDGTYPVFDIVMDQLVVPVPKIVLEKCTPYNICQFIKQNAIFMMMDPEYCDIENKDFDKVFCDDDFDDSYCYDTGIFKIEFDSVQFPCNEEDMCLSLFNHSQIWKIFEQMKEIDYREMERLYVKLRLFKLKEE